MYFRNITLFALGLAVSGVAFAQSSRSPASATPDEWRLPHQSGFWGHAGVNIGRSQIDASCPPGSGCDDTDRALRLYAGGRFNRSIGMEVGVMNIGKFTRGGGDTDGWGLDLVGLVGFPIGTNSSIFAKAGVIYGRTEVAGDPAFVRTGKERGWGPRFGVGAQFGLTPQWAVRADWDRYRMSFPGTKDNVDQLTAGVQYSFR